MVQDIFPAQAESNCLIAPNLNSEVRPSAIPAARLTSQEGPHAASMLESRVYVFSQSPELSASLSRRFEQTVSVNSIDELSRRLKSSMTGCLVLENLDSSWIRHLVQTVRTTALGFPIVAVLSDRNIKSVFELIRGGITEVVLKPFAADHLHAVVTRLMEQDKSGEKSPAWLRFRMSLLTSKERDVLIRCLDGTNTKAIAKELGVTYQTVDKHRSKALRKLEIQNTVELLSLLAQIQFLSLGYTSPEILQVSLSAE